MNTAYLIVGAIGSGKSVVANYLLSTETLRGLEYIGSDIYKGKHFNTAGADKRAYRCADELVFYRIEQVCKSGRDFAYEFCPTNSNKIETTRHLLRKYGYHVVVFFIGTESMDINLTRCKAREDGGMDVVPREKIKHRYEEALSRVLEMIQLAARTYFIDNSKATPRLVASLSDNAISIFDESCSWFKRHVQQKLI